MISGSRLHKVAIAILIAAAQTSCADGTSGRGAEVVRIAAREIAHHTLPQGDLVVRPTLEGDSGAAWLASLKDLQVEPETGHLFGLDFLNHRVVEFTPDGVLVRTFGGQEGQGPAEMANPWAFALTSRAVVIWDEQNGKLLRFSLEGEYEDEFTVPTARYKDVSRAAGDRIIAVPGANGGSVDLIDPASGKMITLGSETPTCVAWCRIAALPTENLVFLDATTPRLYVLDASGKVHHTVELDQLPVFREWKAEEAELARLHGGPPGGKIFVWDLRLAGNHTVALSVSPADPFNRGHELWLVNTNTGGVVRYEYRRPAVGPAFALGRDWLFAADTRSEAVYKFPAPATGTTASRP